MQKQQSSYNGFDKVSEGMNSDAGAGLRAKVFTLDFVIKKIIDYGED